MTVAQNTIRVSAAMRWFLFGAAALVALAGIPLFFLSEQTDTYFAWTINPPLTAAFLGAGYWAVTLVVVLALREQEWTRIRIGLAVVGAGVTLILVATLLHLDRFHLNSPILTAQMEAWGWIMLYIILIPWLIWAYIQQRREPGIELPRQAPLPAWLRGIMLLLGGVMTVVGVGLFLFPAQVAPIWAWILTPLTGRMVGAWLTAIGVSLFIAVRENDFARVYLAGVAYVAYALLQAINLLRYQTLINWSQPNIRLLVIVLLGLLVIGVLLLQRYIAQRRG
jgi:hypothetical protein